MCRRLSYRMALRVQEENLKMIEVYRGIVFKNGKPVTEITVPIATFSLPMEASLRNSKGPRQKARWSPLATHPQWISLNPQARLRVTGRECW